MVVLRHLWTLATHRPAFRFSFNPVNELISHRAIANDKQNFIRFANGLLNETTSLVGRIP